MGDVEADLDRIEECSRALKKIEGTFSKKSNPAAGYSATELGSHELVGAFSEFSSNWKIRREKLGEELKELHKLAKGAAEAYDEVDSKLAEALRDQDQKREEKRKSK